MYAVRNRLNIGDGRIVVPWRIEALIFNPSPRIRIRRSSALYPHDNLCFFRKGLNDLQLVDSAIGIEPVLNSNEGDTGAANISLGLLCEQHDRRV
jgi:hypothetical protein